MLVRIDADPPGPLSVVRDLPDAKLAMLEGLNGIGKTLAIRLLQLCTGTMPYRPGSPAWMSLCDGLGHFRVEVQGLSGGTTVSWEADSVHWKERSEPEPTTDWFHAINVGGRPATLDRVRELLAVHRLAGDEGIVDTFSSFADADAATVRRWAQRYAAPLASPLAALEERADRSRELLGNWSLERYSQVRFAAAEAAEELASARALSSSAEERRSDLASAVELSRRLAEISARAPGLGQELAAVDAEISAAQQSRNELHRELSERIASLARAEPLRRELRNARRTLERNRENLTRALRVASTTASALRVPLERPAIESAIADFQRQVDELEAEQTALDAAPAMRTLLGDMLGELAGAEARGLGGQVALDDPDTSVQFTVTQTKAGMSVRRAYLEGQPPPPESRRVAESLRTTKDELKRAHSVLSALDEVSRYQRLVDANEERVDRALISGADAASDEVRALEERRRANDDLLLQLAARRASVAQQLGVSSEGAGEEALRRRLTGMLDRFGLEEGRLEDEAQVAASEAADAQSRLAASESSAAEARRELARANADIQRATKALAADRELGWLRRAVDGPPLEAEGEHAEQLIIHVDRATTVLNSVIERLGSHRGQLGAVDQALQAVARRLRGQAPDAVEYVDEIESWLANRFSGWFNNPRVRHELLPDAQGDIVVNLTDREVVWREQIGERARPLEAFSSGEQAFAYTRARLAMLDEDAPRAINRLIVLDEFGAFIAHDRLQGLQAYLKERAAEQPGDQVLVILPLTRDYSEMAESAVGSEKERWAELAQEVSQRKYAVQVLVR